MKGETAFQITQITAGNDNFNVIKTEVYWELLLYCVIPVIMYSGATLSLIRDV